MQHPARRRRGLARGLAGTVAFAVVVGAGATGVAAYLRHLDAEPRVVRCGALLDGTSWYLDPDQADSAALLSATTLRRGLPARALTIALATGLQESKLRNIDYGDRDSLGLFQQRPSQGWGTEEQIMDPVYSTNTFLDALVQVDGYEDLPVTVAAQEVQRSGFPDAYAQHEERSRAWASAMYGYTPAAVTCRLPDPEGAGDPDEVSARVQRDFGDLPVSVSGRTVVVDTTPMATADDDARLGWAAAHWAVSVAGTLEITSVEHAGRTWDRTTGVWAAPTGPAEAPGQPGRVSITLAG